MMPTFQFIDTKTGWQLLLKVKAEGVNPERKVRSLEMDQISNKNINKQSLNICWVDYCLGKMWTYTMWNYKRFSLNNEDGIKGRQVDFLFYNKYSTILLYIFVDQIVPIEKFRNVPRWPVIMVFQSLRFWKALK